MMIRQMWPWPKKRKSALHPEQAPRRTSRPNQKGFDNICISRDSNLQNNDMRMVIMDYDSSRRSSKRVIYDSSTILPLVPGEIIAPDTRISECKKFRLLRKKKDVSNLAQLVWGAGPAAHGMDALKFHHINDDKLLISRVFPMPRSLNRDIYNQTESVTSSDSESQYTPTVRSMDTYGMNLRSSMFNTAPPEKFARVRNSSLNIESDESDEFRAFSPPHRLSKNRRIQMSHCSSLCEPVTSPLNIRKPRSRMSSIGSQMDEGNCSGSSSVGLQNDKQVALAIVFTSNQRTFVFQHIPLIEAEMARLECRIATAALYSKNFLDNVTRAWEEFNNSICMLFNAPRLRNPVWLSLAEREPDEHFGSGSITDEFCDQLAYLVDKLDTKETNYFLSNLVSTVLQTHLSWVASVASPNTNQEGDQRLFQNTILNDEFASVPYNPHIAQFLEISGNVGTVNRSTKTVVFGNGEDADTIANLLQILSYFIRCSTVHASQKGREADPLPIFRSFSPEMIGSPISSTTSELGAFSPEKMKMEIEYEVPTGFMDPPNLLVNNVAKIGNADSDDYLGRSLLAGPSTTFSPHFVISGLIRDGSNIDRAVERMCDEVRSSFEPSSRAVSSLSCSQISSLYEIPTPDCVIVMADVGDNSVKILTSDGIGTAHTPSESVVSMFENFAQLHRVGSASKILINYLEDSLYSVLCKSLSLVELVSSEPELKGITQSHISSDRVRQIVACEHSDLRLLVNVASVYYPCVMSSVV